MSKSIQYIDVRGTSDGTEFGDSGTLYVEQPYYVEDWKLGPAKDGDVGMDLPVRIKGMKTGEVMKTGESNQLGPELFPPFSGSINYEEGWIDIPAGSYARIPSGIHTKMPNDSWMMVRPRSSTGFKLHVTTFEGTIDSGYTGHLLALVYNRYTIVKRVFCMLKFILCWLIGLMSKSLSMKIARSINWGTVRVREGDRLVQVVLVPKYPLERIIKVDKLPTTERGASGFGSSGGLAAKS